MSLGGYSPLSCEGDGAWERFLMAGRELLALLP